MTSRAVMVVGLILALSLGAATALAQPLEQSHGGRLACPGFHSVGASELTLFAYPMHNYNPNRTLTIKRIIIYDKDGNVLRDMPASDDFPSGFNAVLGPFQTTIFNTLSIFGDEDSPGLMEVLIDWTADGKAFDLFANITRIVRSLDGTETKATAMLRCVTLR